MITDIGTRGSSWDASPKNISSFESTYVWASYHLSSIDKQHWLKAMSIAEKSHRLIAEAIHDILRTLEVKRR
jgi:hypothetical protein